MSAEALADKCKGTAEAAAKALTWIADPENEQTVGPARVTLEREFRRFRNHASTLSDAVHRPMCVGLFGPSQAGKSYLAAGLSRDGSNPLMVRFAGEEDKHFLSQINPEGDRESTGVVTRFSLNTQPHPDGFPVALRLLTETDVVKILGNCYFLDSDPKLLSPMARDAVDAILDNARAAANAGAAGLAREQIWDLQEYFQKQFSHLAPMTALGDFWTLAEELAPQLDIKGRASLFAPLWGNHEALTETYLTLVEALSQLGFAKDGFAGIDALIPRAKSIIDVETLNGLNAGSAETLAIRTIQGTPVSLPRPVVTALIAELQLTIAQKPWDFFDHTDLLDFPGARNRDPLDLEEFLTKEDALKQLLVRGKVAYLFDRYVADQELTSMLLCVKPSNQDIVSLPGLVGDWIERTHGATAADRNGRPTLLFFILGWFNEHLKELPGEDQDDLGGRFKSRMKTAFTDFFGKSHDWPDDWADGRSFKNCFWLRDPGFSTQVYESADGLETGFRPEQADRLARMRQAYLQVEEVQRYFADPALAWDKATLPNDGGVSHLADQLAPVCEPDMKHRQVEARIDDLRAQMVARLAPYFVSDNIDKRLAERRSVAEEILVGVEDAAEARAFGKLLRQLQIDEGHLLDHLQRFSLRPQAAKAEDAPDPVPRKKPSMFTWPGDTTEAPAEDSAPLPRQTDRMDVLGNEMVSAWLAEISDRAENARVMRHIGISTESAKEVVAELSGAARRLDLAGGIAEDLRRFSFPEAQGSAVTRNAVIGARQINGFVATLGNEKRPVADRATIVDGHGTERAVFDRRPPLSATVSLPATAVPTQIEFLKQWGYSFMRLVYENATSADGTTVNRKQNAALGAVITRLGGEGAQEGDDAA